MPAEEKGSRQTAFVFGSIAVLVVAIVAVTLVIYMGGDDAEHVAQVEGGDQDSVASTEGAAPPPLSNGQADSRPVRPRPANAGDDEPTADAIESSPANDTRGDDPDEAGQTDAVDPEPAPMRTDGDDQDEDDGEPADVPTDDVDSNDRDDDDAEAEPGNSEDLSTVGSTRDERLPPPDEGTVALVNDLIRETFEEDFEQAKTDEGAKAALGDELFRRGADPDDKPENRYVLLSEALTLAVESGGLTLALACIDELAEGWDIDPVERKWQALSALSKAPHTAESAHELADALLALVDEAVNAGQFESADRIAGLAKGEAGKSRDAELRKRAAEQDGRVQRLLKEFRDAQLAEERLATDPDDAEANLVVGKFRCFVLDDWDVGLPLLVKGADEGLARVAGLEMESSSQAEHGLHLADVWWDLGESSADADRAAYQQRARHWYQRAVPKLAGVDKLRAEKRLETSEEDATESSAAPTDLHLMRALSRARKALDDGKLVRTPLAGRSDRGDAFEDLPREAGLLVGLTITLRGPNDRRTITSIQPLYLTANGVVPGTARGRVDRNSVQIQAQEGYAVAGITVRGRNSIEGLSVTFMKIKNGQLNPKDHYTSEWHGGTMGQLVPVSGSLGKPVVGIFGLAGEFEVNALGLAHLP